MELFRWNSPTEKTDNSMQVNFSLVTQWVRKNKASWPVVLVRPLTAIISSAAKCGETHFQRKALALQQVRAWTSQGAKCPFPGVPSFLFLKETMVNLPTSHSNVCLCDYWVKSTDTSGGFRPATEERALSAPFECIHAHNMRSIPV